MRFKPEPKYKRPGPAAVHVPGGPRLFDFKVGGAYMGVSYWTLRDLCDAGVIPTVEIPVPRAKDGRVIRRRLVDRIDLDKFIEANKERG